MSTFLFDRSTHQGRIELVDRDRLDLLHRMSTNDMNSLKAGEGRSTVLTTALARIIDRVIVYHRGETALMICNQSDTVRGWLQRHIFFQDKIKLRDVSTDLAQWELHGPDAATIAESIAAGAADLPLHHFCETATDNGSILVARTFAMDSDGFLFLIPVASVQAFIQGLKNNPAILAGDDAQYELMRIRAGLPGKDHELTEDYIPLEANLWDSVSFAKGCYIGQEIIARMESRNRLAKTLVQLHINTTGEHGAALVGASLYNDSQPVGNITSVASVGSGEFLALGFLKPDSAISGNRLTAKLPDGQISDSEIAVEVSAELKTAR